MTSSLLMCKANQKGCPTSFGGTAFQIYDGVKFSVCFTVN